ncbi:MAG: hypothetical protein U9N85_00165 [Bacteroidota bacterium]|nr:hypothetical protein [Bacteroidota bacterium]
MKHKALSFIVALLIVFVSSETKLNAQGEVDDEKKIFFRNEKSFGFNLNTNGWGASYRYGKRINARKKWLYEGGFNYVKHEKEKKQFNFLSTSLSRFAYGKTHLAVNTQFGMGRQNEIFEKFDKSSISIRFVWTAGGSVAFLKPIYYKVLEKDEFVIRTYDKDVPWFYIWGKGPFFKGFNEIKIIPGGYAKAGFSFEFSTTDTRLNILETGVFAELYPKKLEIMATEINHNIFYGIYFSYRFGKVVSGYYFDE